MDSPRIYHSREEEGLHLCSIKAGCACLTKRHEKSTLHTLQVSCEREQVGTPHSLSPHLLFHSHCLPSSRPSTEQDRYGTYLLYSLLYLSLLRLYFSPPSPSWAKHTCPVLLYSWYQSLLWEWGTCGHVLWPVSQHLGEVCCGS